MSAETIFRFVTVRGPQAATKDEIATGFVRYDPALQSPLVAQLAQAKDADDARKVMRTAAAGYRASNQFIDDEAGLRALSPVLTDLAEWLAHHANSLTKDDLAKVIHGRDAVFGPPVQRLLWDNLIAHTLAGGTPEARELLIWAIRVVNILAKGADAEDAATLQRIANATVLLPSSAHADVTLEKSVPNEAPPAPETPKVDEERVKRMAAYRTAHDELSRHYEAELEKARSADVQPPQVPTVDSKGCVQMPAQAAQTATAKHVGPVTESLFRRVSPSTRGLLEDMQVEPGARLSNVLQQIEKQAIAESLQASTGAMPMTRMVYSGGSVWAYRPSDSPKIAPAPPPSWREDLEYAGIFGKGQCRVKPLGIADFRRVEQEVICWEPGEVAHIENVLMGETRERKTRLLKRSESILTTETSEETTKERDTQTTDRFEIQKETEKVIKDDISFDLGVQVTASYGTVKIQADTKFALAHSSTESDKEASKYAKEVTDRAQERVVKRVREEQIQKVLNEYEETNLHSFANLPPSDKHIVGLYRWVDKVYEAKIVNYGKRLIFEFLVPEPAAFHLYALATAPVDTTLTLEKPLDPRSPEAAAALGLTQLKSHADLSPMNFGVWAAVYGAKVEPPPDEYLHISKAFNRDGLNQDTQFSDSKNELKVPEGYEAISFWCAYGLHSEDDNWITILVGQHSSFTRYGGAFSNALNLEDDFVPVTIMGKTRMYGLDLEVTCRRRDSWLATWKMKMFDGLLKAYEDKLGAYEAALAEAKTHTNTQIRGTNPALNRLVEERELKKSCIRLLDPHCHPVASEAMHDGGECGYPEFDCCDALRDGSYVQFVEQAFEWDLMTYLFYPYFWGRKCNWTKVYQIDDPDPIFLAFLQAGYARIAVPVRPGYREAVLRFLVDGQPWNGGSVPGVDSPLYVSIANDMKQEVGEIDPAVQPWEIRIPTSLTVLQCDSGCVPGSGLPCRDHPA